MPTYYVGPGGNDGNNGLTWALRKLTLNGAEDVPVVAGDTVYVGPGVYREQLTVDVSGGAGNPITYIGDVTGEHTDGVGGIVRITGSDNDQTGARNYCILGDDKDYRVFRGFVVDGALSVCIMVFDGSYHWLIEDCVTSSTEGYSVSGIMVYMATPTDIVIRRCLIMNEGKGIYYYLSSNTAASDCLVENCILTCSIYGFHTNNVSGIVIRNCAVVGNYRGIYAQSLNPGDSITVNNCQISGCYAGLQASVLGEIIEDYNNLDTNLYSRTNVNVGANSTAYLWLPQPPVLHSGESQISGYKFPWIFGALSEWSQIRAITGTNEPAVDLFGLPRPATASKNSWGAVQFHDAERDTTTVQGGSTASLTLNDAGVYQIWAPVDGNQITVSVYCYREANYAGVNPRMVIKQSGQADRTTTDVGAAGAWNQLTDTFTPAADPEWITIDLQSSNTAVAGNYAAYFDTLELSASPDTGEFETWLWDREMADWVSAAGGGGAVSISPVRGGQIG